MRQLPTPQQQKAFIEKCREMHQKAKEIEAMLTFGKSEKEINDKNLRR